MSLAKTRVVLLLIYVHKKNQCNFYTYNTFGHGTEDVHVGPQRLLTGASQVYLRILS